MCVRLSNFNCSKKEWGIDKATSINLSVRSKKETLRDIPEGFFDVKIHTPARLWIGVVVIIDQIGIAFMLWKSLGASVK